jgi:pyruvate dehydrogenase E2 component (dihydrolipoamide acetyltransferase)
VLAEEGAVVPVGEVVAVVAKAGETFDLGDLIRKAKEEISGQAPAESAAPEAAPAAAAAAAPAKGREGKERVKASPRARRIAEEKNVNLADVTGTGPGGSITEEDVLRAAEAKVAPPQVEAKASSLARNLAEKEGVDLGKVEGTGTRGRIMMADVAAAAGQAGPPALPPLFGQAIPMTQMRKVIAKRMVQSAFTAPHICLYIDVEMDEVIAYREKVVEGFEKQHKVRLSFNDLLIKAVGLTIREFPYLNAMIRGEEVYIQPEINVGLAVAVPEGLVVPAIPKADASGLAAIARARADLVERARTGKLTLEEMERGTFTITSLVQHEIACFTAIINPPQSGILSVGKTADQLAMKDGQVIVKKVARLGLSLDHRVIDGAMGAAFLQALKMKIENPSLTFMQA